MKYIECECCGLLMVLEGLTVAKEDLECPCCNVINCKKGKFEEIPENEFVAKALIKDTGYKPKIPQEKIKAIHRMAKGIRIRHGGWEDCYSSGTEMLILELSELLKSL